MTITAIVGSGGAIRGARGPGRRLRGPRRRPPRPRRVAHPARARPVDRRSGRRAGVRRRDGLRTGGRVHRLGDPDPAAIEFNAVYRSDARGEPAGLFRVTSEGPIDVGPRDGSFFYKTLLPQYEGDRLGPIPAAFPKGIAAFYTMKYEVTQGQYADFLNALYSGATFFRAIHGGRDYTSSRGTIRLEGSAYVAGAPSRPANWISWDDGLAFADWAGLRPMTELEFTKAARGTGRADRPRVPVGHGDDRSAAPRHGPGRRPRHDRRRGRSEAVGRRPATCSARPSIGSWISRAASGNASSRSATRGDAPSAARMATGGSPNTAQATNEDWPLGDAESGGYGYRGGGYYERGMQTGPFNPYSPIAYRKYGSWGGGPRSIAYGFRAVRTAPAQP